MPDETLRVRVETTAAIRLLTDLDDIDLDVHGDGTTTVPIGEERLLIWVVVGDPGTTYKITLSPSRADLTVKAITGTNPIESRISTQLFRGSGHIRFKVQAKES